MVYVYELRVGERVIDVGVSKDLQRRFIEHTQKKPQKKSCGKYYGRTDITIHPVSEWPTRKLAMKEEGRVKLSHGFEWTERDILNRNKTKGSCAKGGRASQSIRKTCPHCSKVMDVRNYAQWHGDKCKHIESDNV